QPLVLNPGPGKSLQGVGQRGLEVEVVGPLARRPLQAGDGRLVGLGRLPLPSQVAEHVGDAQAGPPQVVPPRRGVGTLAEKVLVEPQRRSEQVGAEGPQARDVEQLALADEAERLVDGLSGAAKLASAAFDCLMASARLDSAALRRSSATPSAPSIF